MEKTRDMIEKLGFPRGDCHDQEGVRQRCTITPDIKIATNTAMFEKMRDNMDSSEFNERRKVRWDC